MDLFDFAKQGDFERFLEAQPDVYPMFVEEALRWKRRGWTHYSADAVWQFIRWTKNLQQPAGEEFKLNDHYRARMARKAMAEVPELEGFFEIRERRERCKP